jgi:hypothetical protein
MGEESLMQGYYLLELYTAACHLFLQSKTKPHSAASGKQLHNSTLFLTIRYHTKQ